MKSVLVLVLASLLLFGVAGLAQADPIKDPVKGDGPSTGDSAPRGITYVPLFCPGAGLTPFPFFEFGFEPQQSAPEEPGIISDPVIKKKKWNRKKTMSRRKPPSGD